MDLFFVFETYFFWFLGKGFWKFGHHFFKGLSNLGYFRTSRKEGQKWTEGAFLGPKP